MIRNNSYQYQSKPEGRLSLLYQPVGSLFPNDRNPRDHSKRQIRQIARSIETFGFLVPVLVDKQHQILAGHGRVAAAKHLGMSEVPTVLVDHLTDVQRQAFIIADNRLSETSTWNDGLLAEQLRELSLLNLDFNLEATGFSMGEIDLRIEGLTEPNQAGADPADALPTDSGPRISKSGDLWLLGRHRLLCGDALEAAGYAALLEDEQAAMVFTDPPYNVPIEGHVSGLGAPHHRSFAMATGEMNEGEFTNFLTRAFTLMRRHTVDGALVYACMDWRHAAEVLAAGRASFTELKNIAVWVKLQAGMGSLYRSQHELIFIFKAGRGPHRNNVELGRHGRNRTNVWQYAGPQSFGRPGEEGHLVRLHPTVKPVALIADAISDCTARGDIVLDSFLGSGSTLLAAERRGRRCFGIEIDPLYVDLIIRRWQIYAGEVARNAVTGKSFSELEEHHAAE